MAYWSILIAAIVQIILGSLWYGPFFGSSWMKMIGIKIPKKITPKIKKMMMRSYLLVFVGTLITSVVLKVIILQFPHFVWTDAIFSAILVWIGFIAPIQAGTYIWEGKPFKLYAINTGYSLVAMILSALILFIF